MSDKIYRCAQSDLLPDFYALKQPIEIAPDTVEQAADEYVKEFVNYGSDVCLHAGNGFIDGACWQSSNSDNISKAKVIEILEFELQRRSDTNEGKLMSELIHKIKEL